MAGSFEVGTAAKPTAELNTSLFLENDSVRLTRRYHPTTDTEADTQVFTGEIWCLPTAQSPFLHIGSVVLESLNGDACAKPHPNLVLDPQDTRFSISIEIAEQPHLQVVAS